MTQTFALTQRNGDQRGWLHLQQQDLGADWECIGVNGSLEAMADAAIVKQARHPKSGFSFSFPRDATAFMALPFDKQPSVDEIKPDPTESRSFPAFHFALLRRHLRLARPASAFRSNAECEHSEESQHSEKAPQQPLKHLAPQTKSDWVAKSIADCKAGLNTGDVPRDA